MPLTLAEFVQRWKIYAQGENAAPNNSPSKSVTSLGTHPAPTDSVGETFAFEKHVRNATGGQGFPDVCLRDHFAWELYALDFK